MLLDILGGTLLGILAGIFTGLVPGLHVNLFSAIALSQLSLLHRTGYSAAVAVFLLAMGTTHSFIDIIPTLFLGAVDEDSCVSALPGMDLLQRGFGMEAVRLWLRGCLAGLFLGSLSPPLLLKALPILYAGVKPWTGFILLAICIRMLWPGSWHRRLANLTIFLLSGLVGIVAFTQQGIKEPVFPLMSGLFGCASLLLTSGAAPAFPKQHLKPVLTLAKETWSKIIAAATLSSLILVLFPGIGRSQSSAISLAAVGKLPSAGSLTLLGMISTMSTVVSISALLSINKARDGIVIAIDSLLQMPDSSLLAILAVMFLAAALSSIATLLIARGMMPLLKRVPRRLLAYTVLVLMGTLVLLLSSISGLLVLVAATSLGVLCEKMGVKRRMLLGSLLIPVLAYWFI